MGCRDRVARLLFRAAFRCASDRHVRWLWAVEYRYWHERGR